MSILWTSPTVRDVLTVDPGTDVDPGNKDPDKGDKILGDPIKFTVTVTPWNPQKNNIGM